MIRNFLIHHISIKDIKPVMKPMISVLKIIMFNLPLSQ